VLKRLAGREALVFVVLTLIGCAAYAQEDAPTWDALRAVYDYDASAALEANVAEATDAGAWTEQRLSFNSADGLRVPAVLFRPKDIEKPPCVLFLHGYGGSKDNARFAATLMIPQGFAVFAIDARLHGERAEAGRTLLSVEGLAGQDRPMVATVIDNRRALDYLQTREDLDAERTVVMGVSMGGMLGGVLAGVDERVDAAALIVAGGSWSVLAATSEHPSAVRLREAGLTGEAIARMTYVMDPANFVGHVAPRPLLMVNGLGDRIIPRECAVALHEAASDPREIIWFEGGHVNVPPDTIQTIVQWLVDNTPAVEQEQ
jgi:cephalosporin-C deacetylase-like acetyl esterase